MGGLEVIIAMTGCFIVIIGSITCAEFIQHVCRKKRSQSDARLNAEVARKLRSAPADTASPEVDEGETQFDLQASCEHYDATVSRPVDPEETSVEMSSLEDEDFDTYPVEIHSVRRASQPGHYLLLLSDDEELWGNPMLHSDDEGIWYCEDGSPYDDAYTGLEMSDLKAAVVRYEVELAREYADRPRPLKGW